MGLSLQPYKYRIDKQNYYSFVTDAGTEYVCFFSQYGMYFKDYPEIASKIFDFNIVLKDKKSKALGTDKRIADTVVTIVGDFLDSKINAVVYVCDASDGKGSARARKFKSWFNYYEYSSQILQVNSDVNAGGVHLYTALLVHKKNKLKKIFVEAYMELMDADDEEK